MVSKAATSSRSALQIPSGSDQSLPSSSTYGKALTCAVCGLDTWYPIWGNAGEVFCCPACHEVHNLLAGEDGLASQSAVRGGVSVGGYALPAAEDQQILTLSLGGLWCPACTYLIGETLTRTRGVAYASASFIQRQAQISYDPAILDGLRIKKRIQRLGYRAYLPGEDIEDEEDKFLTRLLISGVLAMHIMMTSLMIYFRDWLGWNTPDHAWLIEIFHIMSFVAAIPLVLMLGIPVLRAGLAGLRQGQPNLHTLISIGAFSAFGLSVRNLFAGTGPIYFDTTAMLFFLVTIGRWLEMQAHKSGDEAAEELRMQIPPVAAWLSPDGEISLPAADVKPGMRIRVRPGGRFPVDGIIATGQGEVDQSILTGESRPVTYEAGGMVYAGSISLDGVFEVITTASGDATLAGQMGKLLHNALWGRAPIERLADRLAAWMSPIAIILAGITFLFWNATLGFDEGLLRALSVLLIACPCALGLATPLTLWLAVTRAAQEGILIRSTTVLERLEKSRAVFFDKTGTLSQLPLQVQAILPFEASGPELLQMAASLESCTNHPFAQAITGSFSLSQEIVPEPAPLLPVDSFKTIPGQGIQGTIQSRQIWVGNSTLMEAAALMAPDILTAALKPWTTGGYSVIFAGWDGAIRGAFVIGENIRPDARTAVRELRSAGYDVAILTGDDPAVRERWEKEMGIPIHAGMLPQDKHAFVQSFAKPAIMVGDGINDSPAIGRAYVGIAMRSGADVLKTAADIVLISNRLESVPWLLSLSHRTLRLIRQNLAWSFSYNLVGIGLAMAGLLQPVLAALAMVLSSAFVTANAMRIRKFKRIREAQPPSS